MVTWTEMMKQQLRDLWPTGLSASKIAGRIGFGLNKNAIVSQRRQLGLPPRKSPMLPGPRQKFEPPPKPGPPAPLIFASDVPPQARGPPARAPPDTDVPDDEEGIVTLPTEAMRQVPATPEPQACCWPLGDPRKATFRYCGNPVVDIGQPYCAEHFKIAHGRDYPSSHR